MAPRCCAKIDMASPNFNLPIRSCIAFCTSRITTPATSGASIRCTTGLTGLRIRSRRSRIRICTLEFENHRPLYDWFIDAVNEGRPDEKKIWHPQQIEFARLNLSYTMLSKRKLLQLVEEKIVSGWDDPRMPTISGFRRRGYTPEAIRAFCKHIGVNKFNSMRRDQCAGEFPAR